VLRFASRRIPSCCVTADMIYTLAPRHAAAGNCGNRVSGLRSLIVIGEPITIPPASRILSFFLSPD
jgi:hypothetical protein